MSDLETYFNKNKTRIQEQIRFALENEFSDFYRKKYAGLDIDPDKIQTYKDFQKIPYLTKSEILATPYPERVFLPQDQIVRISFTSGTTGKPLVLPQNNKHEISKFAFPDNYYDERKPFLLLFNPMTGPYVGYLTAAVREDGTTTPMIGSDIHNLDRTATLAWMTEMEGIISTPSIIDYFGETVKKLGLDRNKVKWISLVSEYCTKQKMDVIRSTFPKADVRVLYGCQEAPQVAKNCKFFAENDPSSYHLSTNYFVEILGKEPGQEGEIVITDLTEASRSFPLIRYRSGDEGLLQFSKCECGQSETLKVSGRSNFDNVKFGGMKISLQIIENALTPVQKYVRDYRFVVSELVQDDKITYKITGNFELKEKFEPSEELLKKFEETLMKGLYLAPKKPLEYFIENGYITPLEINFTNIENTGLKPKRLVADFDN